MSDEAVPIARFPTRFFTLTVVLTGMVLGWLGWNAYRSHRVARTARHRDFRIEQLRGTIVHLDEVLTMSARMAVATGSPEWEERYRYFEPKLNDAIQEARALAPEAGGAAIQTDAANQKLVKMEKQSFALIHEGRLEDARSLLFSEEYEEQKKIYADGMEELADLLSSAAEQSLRAEQQRAFLAISFVVVAIPILLATWLVVLRTMHRWRTALSTNNRQLGEQAVALSELNRSLDQKVEELRREIAERKLAEEKAVRQGAVVEAINRVFQEALTCQSSEEVARTCLAVAEKLTGSKFGFIGEVNEDGRFDTIALSDPGWDSCRISDSDAVAMIKNMEIRGIWARVLRSGHSRIVNDPASHPDRTGVPAGHPPLTSFLGVPLRHGNRTIGMIGLANKESGYEAADIGAVEVLSISFLEALLRKRAEESLRRAYEELDVRVQERTAELARSNAELEQFAYVASHDLQEPLRMVASYLELLKNHCKDTLDQEADEFIDIAVDGAQRMQRMIDDLLAYSRVSTSRKAFEPVDCNQVLDEVTKNLEVAISQHKAVVTRDELPTVLGDHSQLVQLTQNLVANGIKFHGHQPPRIHISARASEKEWMFSVQDNGIGIAPQYQRQIFKIFQRVHARDKYPGTGIGLAICKRIVDRHEGRIWVESEPGQGAIFHFSIAKDEVPS